MHTTERNGKYQGAFRDLNGRERTKTFATKREAAQWAKANEVDINRGTWIDPKSGNITLADFAALWMTQQAQWRPGTRASVQNTMKHLLPALGSRRISSLRKTDIQNWIIELNLAPSTVSTKLHHVRTLLAAAVEDERIRKNPALDVNLPEIVKRRIVPLSIGQVERLMGACPDWYRVAIVLGAWLGLRRGEARGLTVDRIDWVRREITVDRQLGVGNRFAPLKTKKSVRTVPASDELLSELSAHIKQFGTGPDGMVLHTSRGVAVRQTAFDGAWHQAADAVGVHDEVFHSLRHHFVSLLIAEGCSVVAVSAAVGHSNVTETLNRYGHLFPADNDRIRQAIQGAIGRSRGLTADKRG